MNLPDLNKEQKQYIVLGAVVSVIALGLIYFGIKFSMSSLSEAKAELETLTDKINKADRVLAQRTTTSMQYEESVDALKGHLGNMPPERNNYSWATEIIYAIARRTHLEVDAIDEIGAASAIKKAKKSSAEVKMESYALRITAHGGYECVKQFLRELQLEQPLVRFSGIGINKGLNPEVHDIHLNIEWPHNITELSAGWMRIEKLKEESGVRSAQKTVPTLNALRSADAMGSEEDAFIDHSAAVSENTLSGTSSLKTNTEGNNGISANQQASLSENISQESQASNRAIVGGLEGGI